MTERVVIQIEAVDVATGVFRGIVSQFGALGKVASDVTDVFSTQSRALDLAKRAFSDTTISIEEVKKAEELASVATGRLVEQLAILAINLIGDSIRAFTDYTEEVKNFSRATGTSAEEASRLIQIADDVRISTDTMTTALRSASKDGVSFTVESLKGLADEYLSLAPGVERNTFLMDKFGRSGLEMGKLLEKGSAGIDELNKGVEESLIVNEEAIRTAEKYKQSQDKLNDSWEGTKVAIGQKVVPAINSMTDGLTDMARAQELAREAGSKAVDVQDLAIQGFLGQAIAEREAREETELNTAVTRALGEATELTAQQIQTMTEANMGLMSLVMSLQSETDSYNESLATQTAKHDELRMKLDEAIATYGANSSQVAELRGQYDESAASIERLNQKHAEAMNRIAYDLFVAKLQADGFTDAEYQMAIQAGVSLGIIDEKTSATAINLNKIATASANSGQGTAQFGDTIKKVMSDGVITTAEMQEALDKINTINARDEVVSLNGHLSELEQQLEDLDGREIDITINYQTKGTPPPAPGGDANTVGGDFLQRANGGQMQGLSQMQEMGISSQVVHYHTLYNPQIILNVPDAEATSLLEAFRR